MEFDNSENYVGIPDGYERLYTPHRIAYIEGESKPKNPDDKKACPFCLAPNDKKSLVVRKAKYTYAILNLFPYNVGHMLIIPYNHIGNYVDLSDNEINEMAMLKKQAILTLDKVYKPKGYNTGMNNARISGAGIPGHVHEHIVPRWRGDSNFFPIIGKTRTVSEFLEDTKVKIAKNWQNK